MTAATATPITEYYSFARCNQPCRLATRELPFYCNRCGYRVPDEVGPYLFGLLDALDMKGDEVTETAHLDCILTSIYHLRRKIISYLRTQPSWHALGGDDPNRDRPPTADDTNDTKRTSGSDGSMTNSDNNKSTLSDVDFVPVSAAQQKEISRMVRWVYDHAPLPYSILRDRHLPYDIRLPVINAMMQYLGDGTSLHETSSSSSCIWHWFLYFSRHHPAANWLNIRPRPPLLQLLLDHGVPFDIGKYATTPPLCKNLIDSVIIDGLLTPEYKLGILEWFTDMGAKPPQQDIIVMNEDDVAAYWTTMEDEERKWRMQLSKGAKVHVCDTVNRWCEAYAMDGTDEKVLIHYDGWLTTWDEWIDRMSPKIILAMPDDLDRTVNGVLTPYLRRFTATLYTTEQMDAIRVGHTRYVGKRERWFNDVTVTTQLLQPLIQLIFTYHGSLLYYQHY